MADVGRWPPVYTAEDLKQAIEALASGRLEYEMRFYDRTNREPTVFQGDVVAFSDGVPVFDEHRNAQVVDEFEHWLVIGNTCDMERDLVDVAWSQVVPVDDLGPLEEIRSDELDRLRRYSQSRRFYLPPWDNEQSCRVADFLRPVGIHKSALRSATRVARLSYLGWLLLHSCLVRFLARGDGRYD
jgi:hypothetical protein